MWVYIGGAVRSATDPVESTDRKRKVYMRSLVLAVSLVAITDCVALEKIEGGEEGCLLYTSDAADE